MIIPTGLAILLLRAEDRDRMSLLMVLTLIPIGALFLSASRGGIAAFFLEIGLILILGIVRGGGRSQLVAGAILLLLSGGLVVLVGAWPALDRFQAYPKLEVNENRPAGSV